jgi:hypothetical protein
MITIKHKFRHFQNQQDIETLILGTFNPDIPGNKAEFFYGRDRNFLWNLLPKVYNEPPLKYLPSDKKIDFSTTHKIGFIDLIKEIEVEEGKEGKYGDDYIDDKVTKWLDFVLFIDKFPNINKVFLTRKTFSDIPNMSEHIDHIKQICQSRNIAFFTLPTPARFENLQKLNEWKTIFNL